MFEITEDNDMIVTLENGEEDKVKILFFYHNDERGRDYYFLYREENPDEVIVMSSADGESLDEVDEEEFDEAQQVFDAYENDPQIIEARK